MGKALLSAILVSSLIMPSTTSGQEKEPPKEIPEKFHNYQTTGRCGEKKETLFIKQKFQRRPCDIDGDGLADVLELYPSIKNAETDGITYSNTPLIYAFDWYEDNLFKIYEFYAPKGIDTHIKNERGTVIFPRFREFESHFILENLAK